MGSPTSNTDRLIDRLVADASPVRRLVDPRRRAALWTAIALVCTGLGVAHFGVRRDIAGAMTFIPFLVRVGLLAATMWLSVVAALRLSVPGEDQRAWTRWWPLLLLGALISVMAAELVVVVAGRRNRIAAAGLDLHPQADLRRRRAGARRDGARSAAPRRSIPSGRRSSASSPPAPPAR